MQSYASVFRTGDILEEGCGKMMELYDEMDDLKVCVFFYMGVSHIWF